MSRNRKTIRKYKKKNDFSTVSKTETGATWMVGQANKKNAVGFCHHPNHIGYLSQNLLVQHDCLNKRCKYLHKYETKHFWIKKYLKKELKKLGNAGSGFIYLNDEKQESLDFYVLLNSCYSIVEITNEPVKIEFREN